MTEQALIDRVETLEIKLAYQDKAIEEIRDHLLAQQRVIEELRVENRELMRRMKEAGTSNIAMLSEEVPPPHY
ncbi:MAG: SlyX family protein [Gammaproteobacteria bacterium]